MSSIKIHPLILKLFANYIFPIGKVEVFYDDKDHSNYLGLKWERTSLDRSPIGYNPDSTDNRFKTIGNQFGEKEHELSSNENGLHTHEMKFDTNATGGGGNYFAVHKDSIVVQNSGSKGSFGNTLQSGNGQAHNTIHPVEVMAFWRRVE